MNKKHKKLEKKLFGLPKIKKNKRGNKKGGLFELPGMLLITLIVIVILVALIPAFMEMIGMSQQSTSLNCPGYVDANPALSYNATLAAGGHTSSIGCMAMKLFLPLLILGVLIAIVTIILYGKSGSEQAPTQYSGY